MKPIRLAPVVCTTLLLLSTASAVAGDIAAVEKAVQEKWDALKSLRGKMHAVVNMETEGYKNKADTTGIYEIVRTGDTYKMRMESKGSSELTMGGQVHKSTQESLSIFDADTMYSYNVQDGNKSAMKMKRDTSYDDLNPFTALKKSFELTLLPEEEVDGQACYVVQASPKADTGMGQRGKMVHYIRKDCGMAVKSVTYTPDGKPMATTTFTDIEINPTIGDDRFVFKAPEGVEVVDMTAMQQQAKAQAAQQEGEKEEPKSEPAEKP